MEAPRAVGRVSRSSCFQMLPLSLKEGAIVASESREPVRGPDEDPDIAYPSPRHSGKARRKRRGLADNSVTTATCQGHGSPHGTRDAIAQPTTRTPNGLKSICFLRVPSCRASQIRIYTDR